MMSRLNLGGSARESRRHSRRRSSRPRVGKTARRSARGLLPSVTATCRAFIALSRSELSSGDLTPRGAGRPPAPAAASLGSAAKLFFGDRPIPFALARMSLTGLSLGMRQSGRRRRFRSGRAPAGRHSHYGEGRSEPRARCAAASPWRRSAPRASRPGRAAAVRSRERSWSPAGASTTQAPIWRLKPPSCGPSRRSLPSRQPPMASGPPRPRCSTFPRRSRRSMPSSGCELSSLVATAFTPAAVSFSENARPASSSRRQTGMLGLALISRTRSAARSLAASFCAAGRFRFFGMMRQRSSRCEAALKMTSWVSVSLTGEFIRIRLSVETALSPSPPRAPNRRCAGCGRRTYRSISSASLYPRMNARPRKARQDHCSLGERKRVKLRRLRPIGSTLFFDC